MICVSFVHFANPAGEINDVSPVPSFPPAAVSGSTHQFVSVVAGHLERLGGVAPARAQGLKPPFTGGDHADRSVVVVESVWLARSTASACVIGLLPPNTRGHSRERERETRLKTVKPFSLVSGFGPAFRLTEAFSCFIHRRTRVVSFALNQPIVKQRRTSASKTLMSSACVPHAHPKRPSVFALERQSPHRTDGRTCW